MSKWDLKYKPTRQYSKPKPAKEQSVCRVVPISLMLLPDPLSWLEQRNKVAFTYRIADTLNSRFKELAEMHKNFN